MNDDDFLSALSAVAAELVRRADVHAGDDMREPCNLILSNAATGCLIALNYLDGCDPSAAAATAPRVADDISSGAILS